MRAVLLFTALLAAGPALAQAPQITDGAVHAFVARQEAAWNAGDFDRYFAGFTPDARFTDQAYVGDKPPVPYGTSTLAQAQTQARRAAARSRERAEVRRIEIAEVAQQGCQRARTSRLQRAVEPGPIEAVIHEPGPRV